VLKPILGVPMLQRHLERLDHIRLLDNLIVATSTNKSDMPVAELCRELNIDCFRGSLDDVLDRFYKAVRSQAADTVVRLTGDCPLADPDVISECIEYFLQHDFDYVSNCMDRTYPIGLDVEVFKFDCLRQAWEEARLPSEREHVTPFIKNHPEHFSIGNFKNRIDLSHHRWTVDEAEDFEFVSAVYRALYPDNPRFSMNDILKLLDERPELTEINYHIVHGEGYLKSLREDSAYPAGQKSM
jgi:spore coat polysaccharide biosynthesis protein SpsF